MEESLEGQFPTNKIYKEKAIWVGTFIGGPLAAGYLISANFKAFNDIDKAKKTWIFAIIATIVIFGGISLIPDHIKIPSQIIPLIYIAIVHALVKHFQGQDISRNMMAGGQSHSWWRTLAVGFIGLTITLVFIFQFAFLWTIIEDASN